MFKKNLIYCVSVAVLAMVVMFACQANADIVINNIKNQDYDVQDQDVIVTPDGTVNGYIKVTNGNINVTGFVNGNLYQEGPGSIEVFFTNFNDDVYENGEGDVLIVLCGNQVFNGSAYEEDGGMLRIEVRDSARFEGNAMEKGDGDVRTVGDGTFNGNSKEEDSGTCSNTIADFQGNACES